MKSKPTTKKIEGNDDNYMGYNERLEKGIIEVNYGELSNQLEHITFQRQKTLWTRKNHL